MFKSTRSKSLKLTMLLAAVGVLLACGPDFPNRLLLMGDAAVLSAPRAEFRREIERFLAKQPSKFKAVEPPDGMDVYSQSIAVDVSDLRAAMGANAAASLIDQYQSVRSRTTKGASAKEVPAGVPAEFRLYLSGVIEHHAGRATEARAAWNQLLNLPEGQRRWRSVWAAFMMGKSCMKDQPAQSLAWFQQARMLASQGFSDNLGLACSSLGWEAKAELGLKHYVRAINLYAEQLASGDSTSLLSLRFVAQRLTGDQHADVQALTTDLSSQRVILAYLVSTNGADAPPQKPNPNSFEAKFLAELEKSKSADLASADRLAWAAYQAGDFARTERWLAMAPAEAPVAQWLRAKMLLRAGKLDEAASLLAKASKSFPADEKWNTLSTAWEQDTVSPSRQSLAEAGVIYLSRRQYVESLDALLRAGVWIDAAYVAERVLTVDELKKFVDSAWAAEKQAVYDADHPESVMNFPGYLRHLLARKLARAHRFDDAAAYMPTEHRTKLTELAKHLRDGRNAQRSKAARGASLWAAAQVMRDAGLELVGTELAPDAAIYSGQFTISSLDEEKDRRSDAQLLKASKDELKRAESSKVEPDKRWHYRYLAAQLAWDASELMPDQDDTTAEVLYTAGCWLKGKDPHAADRFYKALVRRCSKTTLGANAQKKGWFPT